jgi:hypothetical protein
MQDIRKDRIAISENFFLDEFIPKDFLNGLRKWVGVTQWIRETTGLVTRINTYYKTGTNDGQNRGFRMPYTTVGSSTSRHRVMDAVDINIGVMTGKEMYNWALENADTLYKLGVRRIEYHKLTPTWLHMDGKEHGEDCIQIIDLDSVVTRIPIRKI